MLLLCGPFVASATGAVMVPAGATAAPERATESAIFADCHGILPDGRRIRANLAHVDGSETGFDDSIFVTLRTADGTVLGQGAGWWSAESIWVDGHLSAAVDVFQDWIDPIGQAGISFDYAIGEGNAATYPIRNGNHMSVVRQSVADVAFSSVSITFDGVPVAAPACSGHSYETSWISTYPSREIYGYTAFADPQCTTTNIANDFLLMKSGEGYQFYVSFEQPEGYSTLSAPFSLSHGAWHGEVPLSGPDGPAGILDATYSLTVTGPTSRRTEEFPEYGYTERVESTPARVDLTLTGDVTAQLSCQVELWEIVQKWD